MSYFQRYQKSNNNHSRVTSTNNNSEDSRCINDIKKNSQSRQSYLKAFKKYYIQKLLQKKQQKSQNQFEFNNKQNFSFHQTKSQQQYKQSFQVQDKPKLDKKIKKIEHNQSSDKPKRFFNDFPKITTKLQAIVKNNDSQLQQVLFSSIGQVERQMMSYGQINDLTRQNALLKSSISKLKIFLKQKLEESLKKNKQQLTQMFQQYSKLIKKLLQDKQLLTEQLQKTRKKQKQNERRVDDISQQYENKIRIIVQQNNNQNNNTKNQIQQFLQMIVQYQEQANQQKAQLERLRQKVVELQMENDKLLKYQNVQSNNQTFKDQSNQISQQLSNIDLASFVNQIERLRNQNSQLKKFLKTCKCSMIKSKDSKQSSRHEEQISIKYEKALQQMQKQYLIEQNNMRQALKKKDQCIDRLNLIIQELRRSRYQSVDKLTKDKMQMLKN